jgi:hypothetical protein
MLIVVARLIWSPILESLVNGEDMNIYRILPLQQLHLIQDYVDI